jgi:hypothetical protein
MLGLSLQLCDVLLQMKLYGLLGLEARSVFPTTKWNIFPGWCIPRINLCLCFHVWKFSYAAVQMFDCAS